MTVGNFMNDLSDLEKAHKEIHDKAEGYWYVISSYGNLPSRRKTLLELHSRRFLREFDATSWKEFCEVMENKKRKNIRKVFAIVYVKKGTDFEKLF